MTVSLCLIAYLAVIAPLIVLVHELSHVAAALAFVPHDVIVRIGVRPKIQLLKRGRLQVLVQWWGGWVGTWSWAADEVEVGKARYIWIVLAGPIASLLTALLCAALKNVLQNGPRIAYALADTARVGAIATFACTMIPMKYPSWMYGQSGVTSDGYRIWHCLIQKGSGSVIIMRSGHVEAVDRGQERGR